MKKNLSFILILLLVALTLTFVACGDNSAEALTAAKTALRSIDVLKDKVETPTDYTLPTTINGGTVAHSISWKITGSGAVLGEPNNGEVTVNVDEALLENASYTLTATISNQKGETEIVTFTLRVPASAAAIEAEEARKAAAKKEAGLNAAKTAVENLSAVKGKTETTSNYTLPSSILANSVSYSVTWEITNGGTYVTVAKDANTGKYNVVIDESNLTVVSYVLTATISDGDGDTKTSTFNLSIPVSQNAVDRQARLTILTDAKESINNLYKDGATETTANYTLVNSITASEVTHTVSWNINVTAGDAEGAKVTVTPSGLVTVQVANLPEEAVIYTLTATITNANNESLTVSFDRKIPSKAERLAVAVDYAGEVTLNMNSPTLKQEVTVHIYVDGDTTHFNVPTSISASGILKARYLAINTPESTGQIEPWGKAASRFTKEKLQSATSIIIESDDGNWNLDSTGGRHIVWIWYKPQGSTTYRNLNIEILQNGLAVGSNAGGNIYGTTCVAALNQAQQLKLKVFSGEPDPEHYYGAAIELTLRELRCNIEDYTDKRVAFEAVVTRNEEQTVYVEYYDVETDLYYGMSIYYGFNLSGDGLAIISPGNLVRIVGKVSYYATGGTYQVSDLKYLVMRPNDPNNIQLISSGHSPAYVVVTGTQFTSSVSIEDSEGVATIYDYSALAMNTSISMENLTVKSIYVTNTVGGSSNGAMTLTCQTADGKTIKVRTVVMLDEDGNIIGPETYQDKVITVKGIVDFFSGDYQIKILDKNDITIQNQ